MNEEAIFPVKFSISCLWTLLSWEGKHPTADYNQPGNN